MTSLNSWTLISSKSLVTYRKFCCNIFSIAPLVLLISLSSRAWNDTSSSIVIGLEVLRHFNGHDNMFKFVSKGLRIFSMIWRSSSYLHLICNHRNSLWNSPKLTWTPSCEVLWTLSLLFVGESSWLYQCLCERFQESPMLVLRWFHLSIFWT